MQHSFLPIMTRIILLLPSYSLAKTPPHPRQENNIQQRDYLVRTYIQPKDIAKYTTVYGNPSKASVVLIVWTALSCPMCSNVYQTMILPLKVWAEKNKDFALILRDYPTDPISLQASAMIWAAPKCKIPDLFYTLHIEYDWLNPIEKALNVVEILALNILKKGPHYDKNRDLIRKARTDEQRLKEVFNSREQDKRALGLTQVPWAILLTKNSDHLEEQQDQGHSPSFSKSHLDWSMRVVSPDQKLISTIQKTLSSRQSTPITLEKKSIDE